MVRFMFLEKKKRGGSSYPESSLSLGQVRTQQKDKFSISQEAALSR